MDYQKLGERVRQQRRLCRMTQEELAEKAGVSCAFVGHIERGEKKASIETLIGLCNALSVSPTVLLQDSLSTGALHSYEALNRDEQELMNDLMSVLREHRMN